MPETQLIVLSKKPYQESALLVTGFSPDYGKVELVAHGAQKVSAKDFPVIDIFRELDVEYAVSEKSDLGSLKSAELISDFSKLVDEPKHYIFAGKLADFIVRNSAPDLGLPFTYDTLRSVLFQLGAVGEEGAWSMLQCAVVFKTTFLYENGLLPETISDKQNDLLENIVAAGIENSPLPNCANEYWSALHNWLNQLLDFHQLKR